jgi:hypothetical protein
MERHNEAEQRNCAFDVAEEVADVVNICELWLKKAKTLSERLAISAIEVQAQKLGESVMDAVQDGKDEIEVKRVVPKT